MRVAPPAWCLPLICALLLAWPAPARAGKALDSADVLQLQAISDTFVRIAAKITPAVVGVSTSRVVQDGAGVPTDPYSRWFFGDRDPSPRHREEEGLGSGVLISADGVIVTNAHVVDGADHIKVTLSDRRSFKAEVVGVDGKTDLAVLRVEATNLPWVPLGDSSRLRPGEMVLAVGNPFGLNQTVTMGIVSGVGRQGVGITDYEDFIQTDAAINPGNSGGAMVNTRGELIGINTAIFTQSGGYEGIGFAIPSNLVSTVKDSLIAHGRVVRGWLGVSIQEITPELASQFRLPSPRGALVTNVIPSGPAAQAGLKRGDVILAIGGTEIGSLAELRLLVAGTPVGKRVAVRLQREGKPVTAQVTLGELPEDLAALDEGGGVVPDGYDNVLSGLSVGELNRDNARRFQVDADTRGAVVLDVAPGSAASRAGMMPGDVVVEVDRQEVRNLADYTRLARQVAAGEQVLLLVSRQGQTLYVGVAP
ncbi:MAG: DegQ family serine endoprotease [Nitrospirae bacterium]|nr:DegQ family serine endoprotease [Nitrospirota bacterium]